MLIHGHFQFSQKRLTASLAIGLPTLLALFTLALCLCLLPSAVASKGLVPLTAHALSAHPQSPLTHGQWSNEYPAFYAVSAVSDTEAWAGGSSGHLLHYTGGSWVSADPPIMQDLTFQDVKMLSATSGWAVAQPDICCGNSRVFQYDSNTWTERSEGLGNNLSLGRQISALSANDVWAVGYGCDFDCGNAILHWDGTSWNTVGPVFTDSLYLRDISMTSPNEGWVVGSTGYYPDQLGLLLHYDGLNWTPVAPPSATYLYHVSAFVSGEAWAVGYDRDQHENRIYRYSGGTWTSWPFNGDSFQGDIFMLNPNEGWVVTGFGQSILHWNGTNWATEFTGRSFNSISAVNGHAWAVGDASTIMSRSNGPPWTLERGGPTTANLNTVAIVNENDAWAAGYNSLGPVILHYTGTWQVVTTTLRPGDDISYMQMLSPNEGYTVGYNSILRWNGTNWRRVVASQQGLNGIYMTGSGEGWAVGDGRALWHAHDGNWEPVSNPITHTLNTVAMDSPTHGWAGGGDYGYINNPYIPALIEYTGGTWIDRSASLPSGSPIIRSMILAPGGEDGWAVGEPDYNDQNSFPILHLINGSWRADRSFPDPYASLSSVAYDANGEVVAIDSYSGTAYHYEEGDWQSHSIHANSCCAALAILPGYGGWAVGQGGTIVRYTAPATITPIATALATATFTPVVTVTPTRTLIPMSFTDVHPDNYFYQAVRYLYGRGVISGYSDNTFRPNEHTTRGQLCKLVVLARGWLVDCPQIAHFTDVAVDNPFFCFVEKALAHGIIAGYSNNTFHPENEMTRGQLSKVVVLAMGWTDSCPSSGHFSDVPPGSPFFCFVETAYAHGIISGYDGGIFRPGDSATRGQICKIVYQAISAP